MDKLSLTFLPYPHVFNGERSDGLTHAWPRRCQRCRDRQCEASSSTNLEACSYGYNFQRIDESLIIAGVVVRDGPGGTKTRSKALKEVGTKAISARDLEAAASKARRVADEVDESIASLKREVMHEYQRTEQYKRDLADLLRPSIEQTFAQVHDYRQLISQIIQHVNVYLETKSPRMDLDDQLDLADPNIRSIYWAARLMEFKLLSALFLANPERIVDPRHKRIFRLHGAIHKYLHIYKPLFDSRGLKLRVIGDSHGNLMENPDAIGVIPQAFIDNAIKYAPTGSEVCLTFSEDEDSIVLEVESDGPRLAPNEQARIFDLFFRGSQARASGEEGTGFGLGLAQLVADQVGAKLAVTQASERLANGAYRTSFTATFAKPVHGESPPSIVKARGRRRGGPSSG